MKYQGAPASFFMSEKPAMISLSPLQGASFLLFSLVCI
jgi:hypothetical protein